MNECGISKKKTTNLYSRYWILNGKNKSMSNVCDDVSMIRLQSHDSQNKERNHPMFGVTKKKQQQQQQMNETR